MISFPIGDWWSICCGLFERDWKVSRRLEGIGVCVLMLLVLHCGRLQHCARSRRHLKHGCCALALECLIFSARRLAQLFMRSFKTQSEAFGVDCWAADGDHQEHPQTCHNEFPSHLHQTNDFRETKDCLLDQWSAAHGKNCLLVLMTDDFWHRAFISQEPWSHIWLIRARQCVIDCWNLAVEVDCHSPIGASEPAANKHWACASRSHSVADSNFKPMHHLSGRWIIWATICRFKIPSETVLRSAQTICRSIAVMMRHQKGRASKPRLASHPLTLVISSLWISQQTSSHSVCCSIPHLLACHWLEAVKDSMLHVDITDLLSILLRWPLLAPKVERQLARRQPWLSTGVGQPPMRVAARTAWCDTVLCSDDEWTCVRLSPSQQSDPMTDLHLLAGMSRTCQSDWTQTCHHSSCNDLLSSLASLDWGCFLQSTHLTIFSPKCATVVTHLNHCLCLFFFLLENETVLLWRDKKTVFSWHCFHRTLLEGMLHLTILACKSLAPWKCKKQSAFAALPLLHVCLALSSMCSKASQHCECVWQLADMVTSTATEHIIALCWFNSVISLSASAGGSKLSFHVICSRTEAPFRLLALWTPLPGSWSGADCTNATELHVKLNSFISTSFCNEERPMQSKTGFASVMLTTSPLAPNAVVLTNLRAISTFFVSAQKGTLLKSTFRLFLACCFPILAALQLVD